MSPNDIKFFHSGGASNNDPNLDLGGIVSTNELSTTALNNLFDAAVRATTAWNDYVDYRCFYVYNRSTTDTLFDAILYIESERRGGSSIDLGVPMQNHVTKVICSGTPWEGDTMTLNIDGQNVLIDYYLNVTQWQGDFQTKLRGFDNLQDVIVEVSGEVPSVTFTINFVGSACCRDMGTATVVTNGLHNTSINIVEQQVGSPIRTTAVTIPSKLHRPTGVSFSYPLLGNPVRVGNLRPNEGLPVWVRRTTPQGTTVGMEDKFVLRVDGASV